MAIELFIDATDNSTFLLTLISWYLKLEERGKIKIICLSDVNAFSKLGCPQSHSKWQFKNRGTILSHRRRLADIIAIPNCQILVKLQSSMVVILFRLE